MIIKLNKINSAIIFFLVSLILCISPLRMFDTYSLGTDLIINITNTGLVVLSVAVIVMNIKKIIKPIIFLLSIVAVILLHYIVFFENRDYIKYTFSNYWMYGVVLFICVYIMEYKTLERSLYFSATIVLIFDYLLIRSPLYLRMFTEYEYGGVGAVFSYSVLFPGIVFMYMAHKFNKKWLLVPSLFALYLIAIYGSNRMALLSYVIYFFYLFFWGKGEFSVKKLLLTIAILIASVIILLNLKNILLWFVNNLGMSNYTPRFLNLVNNKNFFTDSSRENITSFFLSKIFSFEGLIGYGINGDRTINTLYNHQYAHNIIIQILTEFGLLFGLVVLFFLFIMVYKAVQKKTEYNAILPVLFFTQILALFVSGTFWTSNFFWMFVAVCLSILFPAHKDNFELQAD